MDERRRHSRTESVAIGLHTALVWTADDELAHELAAQLGRIGIQMVRAKDRASILELLGQRTCALLLYDLRTQEESPADKALARLIRSRFLASDLGLLSLAPPELERRALTEVENGADDYILLPLEPIAFSARVRATLGRKLLKEQYYHGIEALRESRYELKTAIESMAHGIALFGKDGSLRMANPRFFELYPAVEAAFEEEATLERLLRIVLESGDLQPSLEELHFSRPRLDAEEWLEEAIRALYQGLPQIVRTGSGRILEIRASRTPSGGLVTSHEDVTLRAEREARLRHLALHDSLTGLPNRLQFHETLNKALRGGRREDERFSLFYMDLDGFKAVNDRYGHCVGDELLVFVAELLRETVRDADLIARLGGDEFAIISKSAVNRKEVLAIAKRIRERLSSFTVEDSPITIPIGISIGVYIVSSAGLTERDAAKLVQRADEAMYRAKRGESGGIVIMSDPLRDQSNFGGRFS